jgi:tRNA A-37 threonylcarbamoyl transferase component Bud32
VTANEDFLFTQEAMALGFVTDAHVQEAFRLQKRMAEELRLDERVSVILVKRGYMAEDQARRVSARIEPRGGEASEIEGYRLLEVVGRGAMGTVYRALNTGLQREVALKILRQDLAGDRTQVERLRAEAAMLASLDHPNIVRALDAGESNGFPYVAMEFVEGETLRDRLRRERPLPEEEALRITRDIADALERARRMGVVHRDVKPGNILLSRSGVPKLMDLGLAKGPIDLGLTQHGATVGTPQYIAPEQAVDPRKADTRSDIYGLGATLYAMLTGKPPFDGQTLAEILTKVLYEVPVPVRTLRPSVSPETGYLVERMMLRDPALRYRTPALVVEDVDRLLGGQSILPRGFSGNWEAYLLRRRVRRWSLVGGVTVATAVLTGFAVGVVRDRMRTSRERGSSESSIRAELGLAISSTASRAEVEAHLRRVEDLVDRTREHDPGNLPEIEARLRFLRQERDLFARLDAAASRASGKEARGQFAEADAELSELLRGMPPADGPARHAARETQRALDDRADAAMEAARREAFRARPPSLEAASGLLDAWGKDLAARWPRTPLVLQESEAVAQAGDAARELLGEVRERQRAVSPEAVSARIAALELAELKRDVEVAGARAEAEYTRRERPLSEGSWVPPSDLLALVRKPFVDAKTAVQEAVAKAAREAVATARARVKSGEAELALADLETFRAAAAREGAWPREAEAARSARAEIEEQTRQALADAHRARGVLLEGLAARLRARDFVGWAADVAAARGDEVYRPVAASLAPLEDVPALHERLLERAVAGLQAHVGEAEAQWLHPVPLRDGSTERKWEVKSVDAGAREFVVVSHKGGSVGARETHRLFDLADEMLLRLAGVGEETPEDLGIRALLHLASYDPRAENPFVRRAPLRAAAAALDAGGQAAPVLREWASARLASVQREVDALEERAAKNWARAQENMDAKQYSVADWHYQELLKPPLSWTEFSTTRRAAVEAMTNRIVKEFGLTDLKRILVGAEVTLRPSAASAPDVLDADVRFTFDVPEQLLNFEADGVARLVPARPGGRGTVTPEAARDDHSLMLLPDDQGHAVEDRPLVLESPLDPAFERSVSCLLWVDAPSFFGIDLDGVQVGILSLDPGSSPFPSDVPLLEGETAAPKSNPYGRGRGVLFRASPAMGNPTTWPWDDGHQGRHFLPKEAAVKPRHEQMDRHWFAFEAHRAKPYRLRLVHLPDAQRVSLSIDDREVWAETGTAFKAPRPTGKIQILTFTTCVVDDLVISGRISKPWFEKAKARLAPSPREPERTK